MEVGIPYSLETPRGTLYFNGFDQDPVYGFVTPYYRLTEIEGLDGAALRTPNEERPQRDGLIAFPFLRGGRFPALVGAIVPRTLAERRQMEDTLRGHMAAMLNVDGTLRWRPRAAHYRWGTQYSSAAVITDAVRLANVEGDGLSNDNSTGVWEATTNLAINGGIETNTTGWYTFSATVARITSRFKFGAACLRCTVTGTPASYTAGYDIVISGATAGRYYTVSAWIYAEGSVVGKTVNVGITEAGGASGTAGSITAYVLAAGWNRVSHTRQIVQNDRTGLWCRFDRPSSIVAAEYFDVDGFQVELQPIATPYVHTNGSTASRGSVALYGQAGPAGGPGYVNSAYGPLHPNQGWVSIAFRAGWPTTADPHGGKINLWEWWGGASKYIRLYFDPADDKFKLERKDAIGTEVVSSAAVAGAVGKVWYVTASWGQSATDGLTISVDGAPQVKAAGSATPPSMEAFSYSWGYSLSGTPGEIDSEILWGALGLGRLTDADVAALYAQQTSDAGGLAALMRGSELLSDGAQPTVLWQAEDASYLVQQERRVPVRSFEPVQIKSTAILKEFRLGMITPDPLMLSEAQYALIVTTPSPYLLTIDNTLDGVDGTGLDALWPVITVAATGGGLTNVDLKNDDTGKIIRLLSLGLAGGTSVVVDMRNETIIKSDGTDLSGKLDVTVSEFWSVAPGQADIASLRNITGSVANHQAAYRLVFAG